MPKEAIRTALKVDLKASGPSQPGLHNRWHPDSTSPSLSPSLIQQDPY